MADTETTTQPETQPEEQSTGCGPFIKWFPLIFTVVFTIAVLALSFAVKGSNIVQLLSQLIPIVIAVGLIATPFWSLWVCPLELNCIGCDTGSWWYTCAPGTGVIDGVESEQCKNFKEGQAQIDSITGQITALSASASKLKTDISASMAATQAAIAGFAAALEPKPLVFPAFPVDALNINIADCEIEVAGVTINPCDVIEPPINAALNGLKTGLNTLGTGIESVFTSVTSAIGDLFAGIQNAILAELNKIGAPIIDLQGGLAKFKEDIDTLMASIVDLNIADFLLVSAVQSIATFLPFLKGSFGALLFVAFIIYGLPLLGGLFGFFMMLGKVFSILTKFAKVATGKF